LEEDYKQIQEQEDKLIKSKESSLDS